MSQKSGPFSIVLLFLAVAITGQWLVFHHYHHGLPLVLQTFLPALAIFGAAFLLSWAAEVAQFDIPQALAVAFVAFVAVLPEYAVDVYFAWMAGKDPHYAQFAIANMTGANRLLIGVGWAAVLFAFWIRSGKRSINLPAASRTELIALLMATIYSFIIPIKGNLSLLDTAVLLTIFIWYVRRTIKSGVVEPELEGGPAQLLSQLPTWPRRLVVLSLYALAGYAIFLAAEPFAEGLLEVGATFGIEQFILVQWIAPLASESPEFLVAVVFAWHLKPEVGLATLVSSKVNQWTLLVASLPLAFCLSSGHIHSMLFDARQVEEVFLTAAQSLFAVSVLMNLRFSGKEALALFVLFGTQLFFPDPAVRYGYGVAYILLTGIVLVVSRVKSRKGV